MGFPIDNPVFAFLYWLLNTPTVGAFAVAILGGGLLLAFGMTLRWISAGARVAEKEKFTFPTAGLHEHSD